MSLGTIGAPLVNGPKGRGGSGTGSIGGAPTGYYQPPFQNHIEQLEQEYDAQVDMVDDSNESLRASTSYPQYGSQPPLQQQTSAQEQHQQQNALHASSSGPGFTTGSMTQQLLDPFDPMLDTDPFGLSASMHFPTQFSFDTSSMR